MKRNFGMWMAIICILVVGVSVTKMTQEFVVSQGVDTAAIVNVLDTNINMSSAGSSMKHIVINQAGGAMETTAAVTAAEAQVIQENGVDAAPAEAEKTEVLEKTEKSELPDSGAEGGAEPENRVELEYTSVSSGEFLIEPETSVEMEPMAAAADVASEEDAVADAESEDQKENGSASSAMNSLKKENVSENVKSPMEPGNSNIQETVKSPLNPVVENKNPELNTSETEIQYSAEMFLERFAAAEDSSKIIWKNVTTENHTANLAAAEQERMIWDSELNYIYNIIRGNMTDSEAETLKILEVEWMKERDLYAEKKAAKSPIKNAQNQNPEYTKALAEKTKERCYWLVSEYEEILSREEKPTEVSAETSVKVEPGFEKKVPSKKKN